MSMPVQLDNWLAARMPIFKESAVVRAQCLDHAIRAVNPQAVQQLLSLGAEPDGLPLACTVGYSADPEFSQFTPLGLTLHLIDMLALQGDKHLAIIQRHVESFTLLLCFGADYDRPHMASSEYASAREHIRAHYPMVADAIDSAFEREDLANHLADADLPPNRAGKRKI